MKNFKIVSVLLMAMVLVSVACTKESSTGTDRERTQMTSTPVNNTVYNSNYTVTTNGDYQNVTFNGNLTIAAGVECTFLNSKVKKNLTVESGAIVEFNDYTNNPVSIPGKVELAGGSSLGFGGSINYCPLVSIRYLYLKDDASFGTAWVRKLKTDSLKIQGTSTLQPWLELHLADSLITTTYLSTNTYGTVIMGPYLNNGYIWKLWSGAPAPTCTVNNCTVVY